MLENLEIIFKCCLYIAGIVGLVYIVIGVIFNAITSPIKNKKKKQRLDEASDIITSNKNNLLEKILTEETENKTNESKKEEK